MATRRALTESTPRPQARSGSISAAGSPAAGLVVAYQAELHTLVAAEDYLGAAEEQQHIEGLCTAVTTQAGMHAAAKAKDCPKEIPDLLSTYQEELQALVAAEDYVEAAGKQLHIEALRDAAGWRKRRGRRKT